MAIKDARSISPRQEKHQEKNWFNHGFNHKTTLTMGMLVPMGCKEVYPGEKVRCRYEAMIKTAPLILPIMHLCFHTVDYFYVKAQSLWERSEAASFESFMKQDPINGTIEWAYFNYQRAYAASTNCILNYLGFNAPPGSGTLIAGVELSAMPPAAYFQIWNWYFRNPNIQEDLTFRLVPGDNSAALHQMLPQQLVRRRNWPRDYYTVATPTPQQGNAVLIPSYHTDPETDLYVPQKLLKLDGTTAPADLIGVEMTTGFLNSNNMGNPNLVLQLSATMRDWSFAHSLQMFLERAARAGGTHSLDNGQSIRWNEWVERNYGYTPDPLYIDQPVWIGGYTGNLVIQDVFSTAEAGSMKVGSYAGKASGRDSTPEWYYTCPDFGFIIPVISVYPQASYYSGSDRMWTRRNKLDYMFEQFQFIGDQPMRNKEVWFSWYDADIAWNDEIFGYVPQYHNERYANDIVSGQMRTLWESFHLGRKFDAASDVVLNEQFIECKPDIGRCFEVDYDNGEHEIYLHAYVGIDIYRGLARTAIPGL